MENCMSVKDPPPEMFIYRKVYFEVAEGDIVNFSLPEVLTDISLERLLEIMI
jgi:hypothetical protein